MTIKIIKATSENAIDLSKINSLTWLNTYKSDKYWIDEKVMNKHQTTEEQKQAFLERKKSEIEGNPWSYIIAKENEKVIWYACGKRYLDKIYNEFFAIYILPEYHNKWVWKQLAENVFNYLWKEKDIIVQVIWYNENAISFYKKLWFIKDKDLNDFEILDWIWVPEIQMIKKKD